MGKVFNANEMPVSVAPLLKPPFLFWQVFMTGQGEIVNRTRLTRALMDTASPPPSRRDLPPGTLRNQ